MARCGRCGLWNQYPIDHEEKKYAGTCLWYQIRLPEDEVFKDRKCPDFFERIPGNTPMEHFKYKVQRDNLGSAYETAKRSKKLSIVALGMSVGGLAWNIAKVFL